MCPLSPPKCSGGSRLARRCARTAATTGQDLRFHNNPFSQMKRNHRDQPDNTFAAPQRHYVVQTPGRFEPSNALAGVPSSRAAAKTNANQSGWGSALICMAVLCVGIANSASTQSATTEALEPQTVGGVMRTGRGTTPAAPTDIPNKQGPDLAFPMKPDSRQLPADIQKQLVALVARLKSNERLALRMTVFAPAVASSGYAIGLATKVWDTLRKHLADMGVPQQRILRSGLEPGRSYMESNEQANVEVRLVVME